MSILKSAAKLLFRVSRTFEALAIAKDNKIFEETIKLDEFKVNMTYDNLEERVYTDTLLVSCVDFRFRCEIDRLMRDVLHLSGDYDEIVLPGSSLSLVEKAYPYWGKTLEEVIGILQNIHQIKRVIFLDHRDCSAYRLIKGAESVCTKELETIAHAEVFREVREIMKIRFPELQIFTLLIGLDGVVENIKE